MLGEIGCLALGVLPGRLLRNSKPAQKAASLATMWSIYALLFILGAKLGGDDELFNSLAELGLAALLISLCCTLGSVFCVLPARRWFKSFEAARAVNGAEGGNNSSLVKGMIGSLYILGCFGLGLALSRFSLLPAWMFGGDVSVYVLRIMLFFVGMGMGFDLGSLRIVRDLGLRVALVPVLAVIGTALGALAAALLMPDLQVRESLAVGAGFGYYSLSSVIISNQGFVALGSIALLANIFRELFTLFFTPLLFRLFGPLAPIAAAGAPAMDTCLPVIVYFSGERFGIVALFTGLVLTLLVPFLVPAVMLLF